MDNLQIAKFSPPRFEPGRHLPRDRIISRLQALSFPLGKTILIEGQAGQGKSQLAIQFLYHTGAIFAWFQLGTEDTDPVLLLAELVQALQSALPEFVSPEVDRWLAQGSQVPENAHEIVQVLLRDLESHLSSDFYLVLDDLHLLENQEQSLWLISSLLTGARKKLHLIMVSRLPVLPILKIEQEPPALQVVDNDELALNRQEIAGLFNGCLKIPVSTATVNRLYRASEGWIMGLILAAQKVDDPDNATDLIDSGIRLNQQAFRDYFSREVLSPFPDRLGEALVPLSLLDEIPVDLALEITGNLSIAEQLQAFEKRCFFFRSVDPSGSTFTFHHLFQECLSQVAREQLGANRAREIWNTAGEWYRPAFPEKALGYFLRAANYEDVQAVLSQVGMQLLAGNRLVTLREFLARVPEDIFESFPWLSFYNGVVRLGVDPPSALPFLESARAGFVRSGDETGELAALVQLVYFHAAIDCRFTHGRMLLERAIELYEKHGQVLETVQRAHAANFLVLGLTLFSAELDRGRRFADEGLALARRLGLKELEAEARLVRSYRDLFAGDLHSCRQEVENSLPLWRDPQVSLINRGGLQLAQLNLLVNEGDLASYQHRRQEYREAFGEELIDHSSFGAIMRMWEIDLALARGDETAAQEILRLALDSEFGGSLPHMRSLYLQYQAYLLARQDNGAEASSVLNESLELRKRSGGREFIVMNRTLLGGALARLGRFEEALVLLGEGLEISDLIGERFVRPGTLAQRAWLHLKQGNRKAARDDIDGMLSCLQESGFTSFYGWDPEVMQDLLSEAVRQGIKPDLAKKLAAMRLGLVVEDGGESFPLLRVRSLGPFSITCRGEALSAGDLSPSMRQLLALLIAAPGHCLDQEAAQDALWPEESPAKGRSNFDALVSRVRKLLKETFPQVSAKEVLTLKRGVLCLKNCWMDIDDFRRFIRHGLSQCRNRNFWQAGNALHRGLNLWRGEFFVKSFGGTDFGQTRSDLLRLCLEGSIEHGRLLASSGRLEEAADVITRAVGFEPTNDALVRQLYELRTRQGKPQLANLVMQNYASALRHEECTEAEIELLLEAFWR